MNRVYMLLFLSHKFAVLTAEYPATPAVLRDEVATQYVVN